MTLEEKVRKQLNVVFTPQGEVKTCGRVACQKAIRLASEYYPEADFGNAETGFMNVQTFQAYFFSTSLLREQLMKVFDTQGNMYPINLPDCSLLIRMAKYFYPSYNFGTSKTGYVNQKAFHEVFFTNKD